MRAFEIFDCASIAPNSHPLDHYDDEKHIQLINIFIMDNPFVSDHIFFLLDKSKSNLTFSLFEDHYKYLY